MFFYFNGCSHTDGVRLEHEEDERFSTLVSNHYNACLLYTSDAADE